MVPTGATQRCQFLSREVREKRRAFLALLLVFAPPLFAQLLCANLKLLLRIMHLSVQPPDIGWPTGNGKKVSNSQACCLAQLRLAAAYFLSISCGPSYVRRLYTFKKTTQAAIPANPLFNSHLSDHVTAIFGCG